MYLCTLHVHTYRVLYCECSSPFIHDHKESSLAASRWYSQLATQTARTPCTPPENDLGRTTTKKKERIIRHKFSSPHLTFFYYKAHSTFPTQQKQKNSANRKQPKTNVAIVPLKFDVLLLFVFGRGQGEGQGEWGEFGKNFYPPTYLPLPAVYILLYIYRVPIYIPINNQKLQCMRV